MKSILLTTIAAVLVVGCGETQPPETPTVKAPDISILKAARTGNIEAVKQHIAAGTDVNTKSGGFSTPLHQAAQFGRKEIAELLIAADADVNASCIRRITRGNNVKEIDNGITPLHRAAFGRHKETAQLLIAKGADVNAKTERGLTPVDYAEHVNAFHSAKRKKETIALLRKHGGKTAEELKTAEPVAQAAKIEPASVKALDISIHHAAHEGNVEAVKQRLAAGEDVNVKTAQGLTPLSIAARFGR